MNGECGYGFVSFYDTNMMGKYAGKLPESFTVFQAEVRAITRAAEYITSNWGLY